MRYTNRLTYLLTYMELTLLYVVFSSCRLLLPSRYGHIRIIIINDVSSETAALLHGDLWRPPMFTAQKEMQYCLPV